MDVRHSTHFCFFRTPISRPRARSLQYVSELTLRNTIAPVIQRILNLSIDCPFASSFKPFYPIRHSADVLLAKEDSVVRRRYLIMMRVSPLSPRNTFALFFLVWERMLTSYSRFRPAATHSYRMLPFRSKNVGNKELGGSLVPTSFALAHTNTPFSRLTDIALECWFNILLCELVPDSRSNGLPLLYLLPCRWGKGKHVHEFDTRGRVRSQDDTNPEDASQLTGLKITSVAVSDFLLLVARQNVYP